jgi:hypothetical protein
MRAATFLVIASLAVSPSLHGQAKPDPVARAAAAARIGAAVVDTAPPAATARFPSARKFAHKKRIETRYDRFTQRTQVSAPILSDGLLSTSTYGLDVYFGYAGKEPKAPPRFVLFTFRQKMPNGNWRYLDAHDVIFLVDDTLSIQSAESVWDGDVGTTSIGYETREYITAFVPIESFLQMLNGSKVEYRAGPDPSLITGKFKADQLEAMRDLASRMMPARAQP